RLPRVDTRHRTSLFARRYRRVRFPRRRRAVQALAFHRCARAALDHGLGAVDFLRSVSRPQIHQGRLRVARKLAMLEKGRLEKTWSRVNDWLGVETRAMYLYKLESSAWKQEDLRGSGSCA